MSLIIEHNGIKYEEGGNSYDGDILLMPLDRDNHPDMIIEGGYRELERMAVDEHGYISGDDVECDKQMIESFIEDNLEVYILDHFNEAIATVDEL